MHGQQNIQIYKIAVHTWPEYTCKHVISEFKPNGTDSKYSYVIKN